ncbi:MAG: aconitase X catalytic domain-containing protein [Spirochaetaceae bacterium]|nr:MAG: aconitase X catalytic domain-containing protein [Spirochaetaceae bacterium]
MNLSETEQRMLGGKEGRLKQVCLENILRYAEILGAGELCEVTKATVFCGAHNYLNVGSTDSADEVFSRMNLAVDEIIPFDRTYQSCYIQSCVSPCDQYENEPFTQSGEFFKKNSQFLEQARRAGVIITGTCAPYLTGWLPIRGEHFVTTESGVTVMGNSIWGAMGNSDGIEAAFWSAICGRTPKWGNHVEENRAATHLVEVQTEVNSLLEWDLLGRAIGDPLTTRAVPVISGDFRDVTFQKLKQLCTTLAISSNCELCHLPGYTPEARSVEDALRGNKPAGTLVVDERGLQEAYEAVCDPGVGDIDFVSLGCPHYDIDQIKRAADYLKGRRINLNVHFMIWTVYPIKAMADENGYTRIIEQAGGHIYTSSCPGTIGKVFLENYSGFVFDSLKQAGSIKSETSKPVYFGDVYSCIEAAVAGRWEESHRWKRSR